ncbi:MAG: tRNA (guanine(10)-N(2))-dimethyltransferase [Candidatus Thorarchaeota archaeon]
MTSLKEYTEGRTTFLTADIEQYTTEKKQPTMDMPVFYNPRMRINRDLSVLFLAAYMEHNKVELMCEPLAGSGVRTLRYLNEIPGDFQAILGDVNPTAIDTAKKNLEKHEFSERGKVIREDAKVLLLTESRGKRFDFVDIDPFGTPVPYLNAAIQSLNPRGALLGVTATDMPALCGVYPHVSLRKYGGLSTRAPFVHEIAVRLLLGRVYDIAAMNDCAIRPLGVLSTDHYIRAWIHIKTDRTQANRQIDSIGRIRVCQKCYAYDSIPLSKSADIRFVHEKEGCKGSPSMAGPLWIGDLYDSKHIQAVIRLYEKDSESYHKRIKILLELMEMEQGLVKYPYTDLHILCDMYNLTPPRRDAVINALIAEGYRAVQTHFQPTAIRTDAPNSEVVKIIRNLTGAE